MRLSLKILEFTSETEEFWEKLDFFLENTLKILEKLGVLEKLASDLATLLSWSLDHDQFVYGSTLGM